MIALSKALRLRSELRLLRHERGLLLAIPPTLPLLSPAEGPLLLSGVACSASLPDAERIVTAPRAFGPLPDPTSIPLRLNHNEH